MPSIPASQEAISIFLSSILYGLYLSTLLHSLRWLLFTDDGWKLRGWRAVNWAMMAATLVLFGCSLTNLSLAMQKLVIAVDGLEREGMKVLATSTSASSRPTVVAVVVCTTANLSALVADCVMIYRCWLVCDRSRRVIIFPVIMWLGGVVCTILQAYVQIVQRKQLMSAWQPVNMTVGPGTILTPFWGSTILLNSYCTSMIVYRIWGVAKSSYSDDSGALRFIMRVLIESGFLYLAVTIAHFVVWWTPNSFAIVLVSYFNLPIIGIAFNLILIRTAKFKAQELKEAGLNKHNVSGLQFAPMSIKTIDIRPMESTSSVSQV